MTSRTMTAAAHSEGRDVLLAVLTSMERERRAGCDQPDFDEHPLMNAGLLLGMVRTLQAAGSN